MLRHVIANIGWRYVFHLHAEIKESAGHQHRCLNQQNAYWAHLVSKRSNQKPRHLKTKLNHACLNNTALNVSPGEVRY